MKKLHPTQQKLLELLKDTYTDPLTIRDLQEELNISSPSVVYHHIQQLEKKGYLKRDPSNPRNYAVLSDSPENKITFLNLYGLAACGPNGTILDGNPLDRVPIYSRMISFPVSEAFLVRAKGDSMAPRIKNGDYVIARKTTLAENGSIVVCVNNGEALIKKIHTNGQIILQSINPNYEPLIASNNFRIEGIVKGIYNRV